MKQIQFERTGRPEEVLRCVEVNDPAIGAPDDILVGVKAFPINPADLLLVQGFYPRSKPQSQAVGVEAVGVVEATGPAVTEVAPGDHVIFLSVDNWSEKKRVKAGEILRVSPDIDLRQLALLKVNPATAALLLSRFVDLRSGEWFLQNAANSAVGRAAIQIAHSRGLRTVNIVRRESAVAELKALGADVVLIDGDDLPQRVAAAIQGGQIRLAADSVSGAAPQRLVSCLAPGGSLIVFGAMSGEALAVNPGLMVFQDIHLHGFWLTRHLANAPRSEIAGLYGELQQLMREGRLASRIDSVFGAHDIQAAVRRAGEVGGAGKVIVTFD